MSTDLFRLHAGTAYGSLLDPRIVDSLAHLNFRKEKHSKSRTQPSQVGHASACLTSDESDETCSWQPQVTCARKPCTHSLCSKRCAAVENLWSPVSGTPALSPLSTQPKLRGSNCDIFASVQQHHPSHVTGSCTLFMVPMQHRHRQLRRRRFDGSRERYRPSRLPPSALNPLGFRVQRFRIQELETLDSGGGSLFQLLIGLAAVSFGIWVWDLEINGFGLRFVFKVLGVCLVF